MYDPQSELHRTAPECAAWLTAIEKEAAAINASVVAAGEAARQAGVYPGTRRDHPATSTSSITRAGSDSAKNHEPRTRGEAHAPPRLPDIIRAVRIGIDVRKLHDFGIGTYIRNLLRQLARLDHDTEYVLFSEPDDCGALDSLGENFRTVAETAGKYSFAEQLKIPLAIRREGVTLFHAPHYVLPPLVRCKSVVTIHDCIHLMFPQYLPNRLSLAYARTSISLAARRATRVLTVSESSKRDILRFVDVPPDNIDVIYNSYDERFGVEPKEEDVVRVRERYQLHDQFVLYAGNVKPHKNLERLIEAFDLVRQRGLDHLKLVLIGDDISKYTALRRAVHRHQLHKYVRFLGYLPEETLAVMYRLASVFVFPSLYEGFGLPPLEAMASGTPVVTSNVSSLPEVAGNAAVLVDPYDTSRDRRRHLPCPHRRGTAHRSSASRARARAPVFVGIVGAARARDLRAGRLTPLASPRSVHDWLDRDARRRKRCSTRCASDSPRRKSSRSSTSAARCRPRSSGCARTRRSFSGCRSSGASTGRICRCSRRQSNNSISIASISS